MRERKTEQEFDLPIYPELTSEQIREVAGALAKVLA